MNRSRAYRIFRALFGFQTKHEYAVRSLSFREFSDEFYAPEQLREY